jgi:predicted  nucleic acid-binding Zn-ribbon protein
MGWKCVKCGYVTEKNLEKCPKCGTHIFQEIPTKIERTKIGKIQRKI